ncbi:S24 family peptidase [uncultured Kiloniella sp.]|uniref:S24 family peptidase n=1 Tax=uncultured Kiloniella sp. TaxID=1133091 RepID=UPI0026202632|nr:S24 family peptidase [uncultured Kiloniella sp.]
MSELSNLAKVVRQRMADLGIPSYVELEKRCEFKSDVIRNLMNGRTKSIRSHRINKLAEVLKVDPSLLSDDKMKETSKRSISYDNLATTGDFARVASMPGDTTHSYVFPKSWFTLKGINPDGLKAMKASGDSMVSVINDDDIVLIDVSDKELADGRVLAVKMSSGIVIKKIFVTKNGYEARAENPKYPAWEIKNSDLNELEIIGRVVARFGTL